MPDASVRICLPDLGDVESVVVVEWLASVGDIVGEGDDLLEVETEKTSFVVPSPAAGRLRAIHARDGDRLEAGGVLGELEAA